MKANYYLIEIETKLFLPPQYRPEGSDQVLFDATVEGMVTPGFSTGVVDSIYIPALTRYFDADQFETVDIHLLKVELIRAAKLKYAVKEEAV